MSNYSDNTLPENGNHAWSILFAMIPEGSAILDVGCSTGNLGKELIDRKRCVVDGIEPDADDAKQAAKLLRHVWQLDAEHGDLSRITGPYDFVLFADVIEHLRDPAATLRRMKPLLKPNGKVLFSIPNMAHVSVRLSLLLGSFDYTETGLLDKTHLHYYDYDEVGRVFADAGMCIDEIDYPQIRYPRQLIDQRLKELDLKPGEKFYDLLERPQMYAYQFIGSASFVNDGKGLKHKPLADKKAIESDFSILAGHFTQAQEDARQLQEHVEAYRIEMERLKAELKLIKGSRSYRLARRASSAARRLTGN